MRHINLDDFALIRSKLDWLISFSKAPQMKYADINKAMETIHLRAERGLAVIVNGFLVMLDVGETWYLSEEAVIEDLVVRLYGNESPAGVVDWIVSFAKSRGNKVIIAGDTQHGLMIPYYEEAGFVPMGAQLIKEVQ